MLVVEATIHMSFSIIQISGITTSGDISFYSFKNCPVQKNFDNTITFYISSEGSSLIIEENIDYM